MAAALKTTVSIVGTAGRAEDGAKMSAALFQRMTKEAMRIITEDWKLSPDRVCLVSGGSAWADHVAVRLYLDSLCPAEAEKANHSFDGLTVYLPCALDLKCAGGPRAADNGSSMRQKNPGRVLNQLHAAFSKRAGLRTSPWSDMIAAQALGATIDCTASGFHARNSRVAQSDYLIAFTWNDTALPKDGGTKDTWDKARGSGKTRKHVPLSSLLATSSPTKK